MKYTESDVTLVSFSSSGKSHWSDHTVKMTLTETLEMILENNCLQIVKTPDQSHSKNLQNKDFTWARSQFSADKACTIVKLDFLDKYDELSGTAILDFKRPYKLDRFRYFSGSGSR